MSNQNTTDLPTLLGRITGIDSHGDGILLVWCPECCKEHRHGWTLANGFDHREHRAAHCGERSAYYDRGYLIGVDPDAKHQVRVPAGGPTQ